MTDIPNAPCCEWCAFAEPPNPEMWQCRRHAPSRSPASMDDVQKWPLVSADDWCGEFELGGQGLLGTEADGASRFLDRVDEANQVIDRYRKATEG